MARSNPSIVWWNNTPALLTGQFLNQPHLPREWLTNNTTSTLFWVGHPSPAVVYNVYTCPKGLRTTRRGARYTWSRRVEGIQPGTHQGSVRIKSATRVVLHSRSPVPGGLIPSLTFLSTLGSFGNPSLWVNLNVNGDGEWICAGVLFDSPVIVYDGLHMSEQSFILCSARILIYCRNTRLLFDCRVHP
jgi:hypothetical protein